MQRELLAEGRWRAVNESLKLPFSFRSFVVAVALALTPACSFAPVFPVPDAGKPDSGITITPDGGPRPDGGLQPEAACSLLNGKRCDYLARCGLINSDVQSLDQCEHYFEATWCGPMTWPSHVAAGTLKFEPSRAESCASAFDTQACGEWNTLPDSCTRFLVPRVALGGDCYDGFTECTEGVCRGSSCPRTCQPRALLDDPCTSDAECKTPLYCKRSPFMPATGKCAAFGTNGTACENDKECLEGLHCLNQTCRALPAPGTPCAEGLCAETGYCDGVGDAGICITRKSEGATCTEEQCASGLVCDPIRAVCVRVQLSSGDLCSLAQVCPQGQVCVGASANSAGTCLAPKMENEHCETSLDCESHLACLAADGGFTCQRRSMAGSSCRTSATCQAGATCLNGSCVELPGPGQSCADTRECRWGLCRDVANTDGGAICGALLSAAQPCTRGEECASGACVANTCVARCVP